MQSPEAILGKVRVRLAKAAFALDMDPKTLRELAVDAGEFTVLLNSRTAKKKIFYLLPDEVLAYGYGGLDALREHRAKQARERRQKAAK